MPDTADGYEIVFTTLALAGIVLHTLLLFWRVGDLRAVGGVRSVVNAGKRWVALMGIINNAAYMVLQVIFAIIGVYAIESPPSTNPARAVPYAIMFIVGESGLIVAALFGSYARRKLYQSLDQRRDRSNRPQGGK